MHCTKFSLQYTQCFLYTDALTSHRMWLNCVTADQHALICAIIKQRAASDTVETPST